MTGGEESGRKTIAGGRVADKEEVGGRGCWICRLKESTSRGATPAEGGTDAADAADATDADDEVEGASQESMGGEEGGGGGR
jgi:hypothetical protein